MLIATIILWGHSLAALLFGLLAIWAMQGDRPGLPRVPLAVALAMTALWALGVAGIGTTDTVSRLSEGVRNLGWLIFMFAAHRAGSTRAPAALGAVYLVAALVVAIEIGLFAAADGTRNAIRAETLVSAAMVMRMMATVAALVLLQNLHGVVRPSAARLVLLALAGLWLVDVNVYAVRMLTGERSDELHAARGIAAVLVAAMIAIGLTRRHDWQMQLSRTVAMQSLSVLGLALYVALLIVASTAIATLGGDNARAFQSAFVIGSAAATLTLISSPWLRAWTKVKLAKHLFRHRYDYRAEWLRFTETLGRPGGSAALDERVVKAVADLVDAPAGLLLVADGTGLGVGAGWRWDRDTLPGHAAAETLATHLNLSNRVVELDAVRTGDADRRDTDAVPQWMLDLPEAWVLVPLPHFDRLAGVIVLARPPIDRSLDWEDFDLLKIAGRQVASYLAEARATSALMEAQRFEEFNRRFAFIIHDIKNLVSQLSLVARNAERHADNPDFRADMVATLKDSAGRMSDLLARLSAHQKGRADAVRPIAVLPIAESIAAGRRQQHPIATSGSAAVVAMADPARLEQLLSHLVQNAVEASQADEPVTIAVAEHGDLVHIDVGDRGCGMSPSFVREQLFRPFSSSKPAGFGIGAYEARELAEAMGGRIDVTSREGHGSRFRVVLRSAAAGVAAGVDAGAVTGTNPGAMEQAA